MMAVTFASHNNQTVGVNKFRTNTLIIITDGLGNLFSISIVSSVFTGCFLKKKAPNTIKIMPPIIAEKVCACEECNKFDIPK